jgi:hypothetical protein
MPSAKEMRDELRKLRKESATHKPVSKMRVVDIASEIERLKSKREDTPSVASTPADKAPKKMMPKITDVKEAKAKEFPTAPAAESKKKSGAVVVGGSGAVGETTTKPSGKKNKLAKLLAMLDSDSE